MKNNIDIEIIIPGNTRHLRLVGRVGQQVVQELDCSEEAKEELSSQLVTVLTEGFVNAIKYAGCTAPDGQIHVRITLAEKNLVVRIYDTGAGFDLDAIPDPCFSPCGMEDKGRGIFILRSLMDRVTYTCSKEGNVLEMIKELP